MKFRLKHLLIISFIIIVLMTVIMIYYKANENINLISVNISEHDEDNNYLLINVKLSASIEIENENFICTNGNLELYVNSLNITKAKGNNGILEVNIQLYNNDNQYLLKYLNSKNCFLEFSTNSLFKRNTLINIPFNSDTIT